MERKDFMLPQITPGSHSNNGQQLQQQQYQQSYNTGFGAGQTDRSLDHQIYAHGRSGSKSLGIPYQIKSDNKFQTPIHTHTLNPK